MYKIIKKISIFKNIIVLTLLFTFLILSCKKKTEETGYEITKVTKGDISLSVSKTGQVVSDNEISVYTTASQRVEKVFFKEGDNVKKGDVVVTFYTIDKNEALRNIESKRLEIQKYQRNVKNAEELVKIGGESRVNLEDARIALQAAQLELATLLDDFSQIKSEITSPVDGVITSMTADENYKVNTETTLFKVSDVSNMKIEVSLSDSQIKDVQVGQRVEITSDALGDEKIEGHVAEISGVAEKSTTLDESNTTVVIKFNDAKTLKPGTTINATIFYKESNNILKVPYTSIINENGKYYAYKIVEGDKVTKVEVTIGANDSSFYEIKTGLNVDDNIILIVDEKLKDGDKIKVIDAETARKNRKNNSNKKSQNSRENQGGGPGAGGPPR